MGEGVRGGHPDMCTYACGLSSRKSVVASEEDPCQNTSEVVFRSDLSYSLISQSRFLQLRKTDFLAIGVLRQGLHVIHKVMMKPALIQN